MLFVVSLIRRKLSYSLFPHPTPLQTSLDSMPVYYQTRGALMSQKSSWLIYANLVAVLNQSPVLQAFPYNSISKRGNIFCANGVNVCLAALTLQILDILRLCLSLGLFVSHCTVGLFWGTLSFFLLAITKFLRQTGSKFVLQNSSIT